MQITITGPRGGGATTLAAEIMRHLEGVHNQKVKLACGAREAGGIRAMAATRAKMTTQAMITIVVSQECEDEYSARARSTNADVAAEVLCARLEGQEEAGNAE
jgi:cytidylate kinase